MAEDGELVNMAKGVMRHYCDLGENPLAGLFILLPLYGGFGFREKL